MKHLFVPYAIALTLKEKGFDEPCFGFNYVYFKGDNVELKIEPNERTNAYFIKADAKECCLAPVYQQVVDWFRDKHSIYIAVLPFREKDIMPQYSIELCWYYSIVQDDEDLPDILCNEDDLGAHGLNYATPQEAYDEAFNEALKLI